MRRRWRVDGCGYAAGVLGMVLCGCTKYRPQPLPTAPDLAQTPQLTVPAEKYWLLGLRPHAIPVEGLDVTTVETLAVFNNPDLKAARLEAGVASAQLLEAGLLPDPELDANFAKSALDYGGAMGLTQDIRALLLRGAAKASAQATARQVNLNILWQEWQVAERARELFVQMCAETQLRGVLAQTQTLLAHRYQQDHAAMQRGDATATTVAADGSALADANTSLSQLETESNTNRHALNALLGLEPEAQLHLIGPVDLPQPSPKEFAQAVAALPRERADLLALQAGYQSQEENVRRAVLGQFPALSAGVDMERDPVEGVNAAGPHVALSLPLFNRNRGQIAMQRATREALRAAYQARLDAAQGEADQVWQATKILAAQLRTLEAQLPELEQTAKAAEESYQRGNLGAAAYAGAETGYLAKEAEAIRLRAALENARSALRTLLALPFVAP